MEETDIQIDREGEKGRGQSKEDGCKDRKRGERKRKKQRERRSGRENERDRRAER